jgi:hypothetical protein
MSDLTLVSDLEPPKTLRVNVKGLAPRRAELARMVAWRKEISAELDTLGAGRPKLAEDLRRLEKAKAAADSETSTAAENVLARIKQGLPWSIAPTKSAPDCTTELQIARTALERLDAERASLEARIESLGNRILSVARRALYEHGAFAAGRARSRGRRWPRRTHGRRFSRVRRASPDDSSSRRGNRH